MNKRTPIVTLAGEEYVIVPRKAYDRLAKLAEVAELPALPRADRKGNYAAVDYARASLARNIIRDRVNAGLSQRELADRAGVRVETLCRIEKGKHSPSVPTIEKIDRVLKQVSARSRKAR